MVGDRNKSEGEAAARVSEAAPANAPKKAEHADAREPVIEAAQLMRGRRAIGISHHGEIYRLRITSKDKLILTK